MYAPATVPKNYDDLIINASKMALHDMQYLRNYTWIVRGTMAQQYLSRMLIVR